jgi:hypothetical protein
MSGPDHGRLGDVGVPPHHEHKGLFGTISSLNCEDIDELPPRDHGLNGENR